MKTNQPRGERDPRLYYGQRTLRAGGDGIDVALVPFERVDQQLADTLTASARTVPPCVVRDYGQERISGYQVNGSKTRARVRANDANPGLGHM